MRIFVPLASVALLAVLASTGTLPAQRVQFQTPQTTPPPLVPVNPNWGSPPGFSPPAASLGGTIQPFDPYAVPGSAPTTSPFVPQPGWPGAAPGTPLQPLAPGAGLAPPPNPGLPYGQPISPYGPTSPYSASGLPPLPGDANAPQPPFQRLFQDTGLRGTYIYGDDKDDLGLTEAEVSTTAYLANFLGIPNGLRVTPGFVFHWTDGPAAPETSDVPSQLYSGYVDLGLEPQLGPRFALELTARVGVYSDFETFTSDSIRLLGTGVGVFQVTDYTALKLGVAYIDRLKVKLLPAAGILWQPNPQTRWDIFFPAPKLSNYWTTVGNKEIWWYLGGEYGGGSWSIEREEDPSIGASDRIDINDIRAYVGLEWWNLNRYYAFAEIGYVFNREVIYFLEPGDSLQVDDSFMVRAGFSW